MTWGRRLDDERLRRAAVQWARQLIEQAEARRRIRSRSGRFAVLLGLVVFLVAGISWMAVREDGFPWNAVVWWVIWPAVIGWMVGGPRRALRVNSDPGSAEDG